MELTTQSLGCTFGAPSARISLVRLLPTTMLRMVPGLTPFLRAASRYQTPLDTGAMPRKSTATRRDDESNLKTNIVANRSERFG